MQLPRAPAAHTPAVPDFTFIRVHGDVQAPAPVPTNFGGEKGSKICPICSPLCRSVVYHLQHGKVRNRDETYSSSHTVRGSPEMPLNADALLQRLSHHLIKLAGVPCGS